ncbi:DUF6220 domain-containing protein [Micromonospora zhanjiangensis]|uniref:DUF6220 domain-containing protein n=1 Tax=Micromonospora zhanjiangensis TaxID=1522057 RepID=A0ABV8KR98_9ACTN
MRKTFAGLAILLVLVVVAQFYFAAAGGFSTDPDRSAYRPHHALGYVIFTLPLVMAAVAALARLPRRLVGLPVLTAGLTSVQVLLGSLARGLGDGADSSTAGEIVFGLHGITGLAVLALAGLIARLSWTLSAAPARPVAAAPDRRPVQQGR